MDVQTPNATSPIPVVAGQPMSKSPNSSSGDLIHESAQAKFVSAPGYPPGPSFSYNVITSPSTASSSSVVNQLSMPAVGPLVLGLSSSTGPSFSYNILPGASGLHSGLQNQSSTQFSPGDGIARQPIPSGNSQVGKNTIPSAAASLQPPASMQTVHLNFVPGNALPGMPPPVFSPISAPRGAPPHAANMADNRNPQLVQKDQFSKSTASATIMQDAVTVSSAASISHSVHSTSAGNPWVSTVSYAPVSSGMPAAPGTPGPPGLAQHAPYSSNMTSTAISIDSSVPAPLRPVIYPSYPSHLAVAAPPQGPWLQPPQMSSFPRPQLLPYPSAFAGPFSMPACGMPPLSIPLPESQPAGVTPLGSASSAPFSTVGSGHELLASRMMQSDLPPGIDGSKKLNDAGVKDAATVNGQVDSWTSHKTETGIVYYYNAITGESTYEKPSDFKGEVAKVDVQPIPVQWEKLAGTSWVLVNTNDGKKYYYNNETKVSSWHIPTELTELRKKQYATPLNEDSVLVSNSAVSVEKGSAPISLSAPAINTGGRDATALRPLSIPGSSALDLIKKKLQDSGVPATNLPLSAASGSVNMEINGSQAVESTGENNRDKPKDANGDNHMSDSSSDSEDEDSGPTKEQCIIQFKEMLKEREVAPFSKWEKELPKIVFDPRFKAIPSHSIRRSLFEHYVKTRAEEERKEKRAAQKAAVDGFKQLLEEASQEIDHNTDYHAFKKKWGTDPRFEALDRKDRELLLNERILPLKKAADEKAQAIRAAAASSFKSMLQEKGDLTANTRWSRVKDTLRNDARYKSVKHEDRELLFNEYVSELKAKEEEAEWEAKSKRQEQEKLKERERELRKRKEREEEEMERVRLKVRRKEAVSSYQALLVETIKDPQASWTESKPKLEKDSQGRASNTDLDSSELEKLFREHVKMLHERCANKYKALLAEVLTIEAATKENEDGKTIFNSWSTAKRLLKSDPRYTKMPRKDRELLWRRFADDIQRKHKLGLEPKEEKYPETTSNESGRYLSRSRTHDRR